MMDLSILMPTIGDSCGPRDLAATYCRERWLALCQVAGITGEIVTDTHRPEIDGRQINLCAITNRAADKSTGAYLLVTAADMFLNMTEFSAIVLAIHDRVPCVLPHGWQIRLTNTQTHHVYLRHMLDDCPVTTNPDLNYLPSNDTCLALSREAWETINGADERFVGYGYEELAYVLAIKTVLGPPVSHDGPLYHLWHPTEPGWGDPTPNASHYHRYVEASGNVDAMRLLIAGNRGCV